MKTGTCHAHVYKVLKVGSGCSVSIPVGVHVHQGGVHDRGEEAWWA